jgi:hypothetical protein
MLVQVDENLIWFPFNNDCLAHKKIKIAWSKKPSFSKLLPRYSQIFKTYPIF